MKPRLVMVLGAGVLWLLAIALRLYDLQVVHHARYVHKAHQQQQRVVKLDSPRGTIYDAAGRELAVSVQVDSIYAVPAEIEDRAATAKTLAGAVPNLDAARTARLLAEDREFVWLARKLDPPVAEAVRRLGLPGIYFLPESKRYYPMRGLAAQVLGYVGTDNHGLAGVEQLYDDVITGKPGIRTVLRDARRGTMVSPELLASEPQPGRDLYLTLDAAVQHMVEDALASAVAERGARRGSAVFLDPATGAVLAMASFPGFDPNEFASYPPGTWRNRPIVDAYEPGSTFKVVTAAAALDSGMVRPDDPFDCGMGGITLSGILIRDHKRYGILPFADVIAKSSNVGAIRAALIIGGERLYRTIVAFGFGRPTGIDLPGESAGILHPLKRWGPLTKAYVAFGQGISVTPLQLAAAVAAVANDGTLVRPYVVAAVRQGSVVERRHPRPTVAGRPIARETSRVLKEMLERVVISGTGKSAAVAGYRVAGKTGTAQIPVAGGYARHGYLPSFVGFAPVDRPALVGVVAVDQPQGQTYYGGQVAAPVFGALTRQILLHLGIAPERPRPALWPGEVVTAELAPRKAAETGETRVPDESGEPGATGEPGDAWGLGEDSPELWHSPAAGAGESRLAAHPAAVRPASPAATPAPEAPRPTTPAAPRPAAPAPRPAAPAPSLPSAASPTPPAPQADVALPPAAAAGGRGLAPV
ncbi:MAG TPA: penicillin-binding protein 2 [Thermoanaerobaculia bacterium]|nr:penicillin-binding protein 2 [Thermoanaerobaculia bacterium]